MYIFISFSSNSFYGILQKLSVWNELGKRQNKTGTSSQVVWKALSVLEVWGIWKWIPESEDSLQIPGYVAGQILSNI